MSPKEGQVKNMAEFIVSKLGGIDILVNNVGIISHRTVTDTELGEWGKDFSG